MHDSSRGTKLVLVAFTGEMSRLGDELAVFDYAHPDRPALTGHVIHTTSRALAVQRTHECATVAAAPATGDESDGATPQTSPARRETRSDPAVAVVASGQASKRILDDMRWSWPLFSRSKR